MALCEGILTFGGIEMTRVILYEVHNVSNFGCRRCTLIDNNIVTGYFKALLRVRYKPPLAFQFVVSEIVQPNVHFHYVVRLM